MSDKHIKHPPIKRSTISSYHRCEWGVYGSTCGQFDQLMNAIHEGIGEAFQFIVVDADHSENEGATDFQIGKRQFHMAKTLPWNEYDNRLFQWNADAIFINGNHYPADRQIVILDLDKKDSLFRRKDQLTNVDLILTKGKSIEVYDFLQDKLSPSTKVLPLEAVDDIVAHIKKGILSSVPELKAVILAGGASKRMGEDKSTIKYQRELSQTGHLAKICANLGLETYISRSHLEVENTFEGYPVIKDKMVDMGPYGAISSAFIYDPNVAYLVLACDLPLVDEESIKRLITKRNHSRQATAYKLSDQRFPEPLIAIYEPSIYQRMLRFLSLGYACPRKVLINSDVEIVDIVNDQIAFNANTPEERNKAMEILNK